jgi:cell division transport system permease protein
MSALRFSFSEAALSLWRGRRATSLSILTIVAAVFVLGVVLLATTNVERWAESWRSAAEFSVYLADDISGADRNAVRAIVSASPAVEAQEYVTREEAGRRFARMFPDLAGAAASGGALPASFEIRARPAALADGEADRLAARLRAQPGVTDVRFDRAWLDRVARVVTAVRYTGLALGIVLICAAALTVASVVRLTLQSRLQEIDIMYLVGAPLAFIRGPFIAEGVLQGGIGASLAVAILAGSYLALRARLTSTLGSAVPGLQFLPWTWIAALLAGGVLLGCAGGLIASRSARAA